MPMDPHAIKEEAPNLEELVLLLRSETAALHQGRDAPIAFLCSMGGALAGYALATLPRKGSGSPESTENERMLIHQVIGLLNALADIY